MGREEFVWSIDKYVKVGHVTYCFSVDKGKIDVNHHHCFDGLWSWSLPLSWFKAYGLFFYFLYLFFFPRTGGEQA